MKRYVPASDPLAKAVNDAQLFFVRENVRKRQMSFAISERMKKWWEERRKK